MRNSFKRLLNVNAMIVQDMPIVDSLLYPAPVLTFEVW